MTAAIRVHHVHRSFGRGPDRVDAIVDASFEVQPGEVVALLGSNGAGKTTLTKIISTLLLPTSGSVSVLGHDVVEEPRAARALTSVVLGGDRGLYARISGRENLRFFAMLAGLGRRELAAGVPTLLEQVGLDQAADRRVETYSKGMRQRLHVAIALITSPRVLLLDEPTIGLDPLEADNLRDSIGAIRAEGASVLLTSHYLMDVERLADRVVMLESGRVTADLSYPEFAALPGYAAVLSLRIRGSVPDFGRLLPAGVAVDRVQAQPTGTEVLLRLQSWGADLLRDLGGVLASVDVVDMQVRPARLEEAFSSLLQGTAG